MSTTTTPSTTTTATLPTTTTTTAPVTVAPTQEPTTPPKPTAPPTTTISPELTNPSTILSPQPATTLSPTTAALTTPPPPEGITRKAEGTEAGELVVVTQSNTKGAAVTPSVVMVAAELVPVTMADGLSGDLEPAMPLMIPDFSLEVVTDSPHTDTDEAEGTLSPTGHPTLASSGFPPLTLIPVGKPATSEPSLYLDLTQTPIPMPTHGTDAESPGTDPEVLLWSKEEVDDHAKVAVQSENDTTTFSAATVLSGDGDVDHTPPSYHLLDIDSELDYQYDPADAVLPVSSATSFGLLWPPPSSSSTTSSSQSFSSLPTFPTPDWAIYSYYGNKAQTSFTVFPFFPAPPLPSDTCVLFVVLLYRLIPRRFPTIASV